MSNPTQYHRPMTLKEAAQMAKQPDSIAIAGGALTFNTLLLPYEHVIDLQSIPALQAIEQATDHLTIGGAVSLQRVVEDPLVPGVLKPALTRTLSPNQRNGASVGESLIAVRPLSEWLAALTAVGTIIQHNFDGELAEQAISDFLIRKAESNIRGFITKIILPNLGEKAVLGTAYVARTPADHPIVHAAVRFQLDDDGVVTEAVAVIGGASKATIMQIDLVNLVGNPLNEKHIDHAVKPIPALVNPVADYKGSVDYRREMAKVCVRRSLMDGRAQLG